MLLVQGAGHVTFSSRRACRRRPPRGACASCSGVPSSFDADRDAEIVEREPEGFEDVLDARVLVEECFPPGRHTLPACDLTFDGGKLSFRHGDAVQSAHDHFAIGEIFAA